MGKRRRRLGKSFLLILFLIFALTQWGEAAQYYVDNSCANNGTGATTVCAGAGGTGPFNSIANAAGVAAGSTVSLKGGLTFREQLTPVSGTLGSPTIYNSYGTGKAIIKGSDLIVTWALHEGNIWQADVTTDPSRSVWFDGTLGTKVANHDACTAAGNFFWAANVLYVYATASPETIYTNPGVEAGKRARCIYKLNGDYITIDNLSLAHNNAFYYGLFECLSTAGTADGFIVQNCEIGPGEGNGIYFYGTTGVPTGAIAQNNYIHDMWNGLNYAAGGTGIAINSVYTSGSIVRYNRIYDCYVGIGDGGSSEDNQVYYNLVVRSKINGIDHEAGVAAHPTLIYNNTVFHRPSVNVGHGICCQVNGDGCVIKNNIIHSDFSTLGSTSLNLVYIGATDYTNVDIDNNLYFLSAGATTDHGALAANAYNTFALWKAALAATGYSGKELNGKSGNAKFVDLANLDFHLTGQSPAIGAGVDVGLTSDYAGRPIQLAPDMGAYEYEIRRKRMM